MGCVGIRPVRDWRMDLSIWAKSGVEGWWWLGQGLVELGLFGLAARVALDVVVMICT